LSEPFRSRPFNPLHAVGQLFEARGQGTTLGSCFAFRKTPFFLTAAHVVVDRPPAQLAILMPKYNERYLEVERVTVHPEADVAVLRVDESKHGPLDLVDPFWNTLTNWNMGEDFMAYGYPDAPAPRLFKGHFMRFMDHTSYLGYRYLAGEISIPVPTGLSGGPLFRPGAHSMVTALVTENLTSHLVEDSTESLEENGSRTRTEVRRVVSYGVVVMLSAIAEWLDFEIPGRTIGSGQRLTAGP
jgi:hypothetical protein